MRDQKWTSTLRVPLKPSVIARRPPVDRLDFEAPADRCVREHGRPALTALREFRAHAEGRIQEEIRRVGVVELGIQIVTPDQSGEAITEQILLEPRLFECPLSRRLDAAHALGVPGKPARVPSVDSQPVEKHRRAGQPTRRRMSNVS